MKYKKENFYQVHKEAIQILNGHNQKISCSTRWLYVYLIYLEHLYTGTEEDFFFHSIDQIKLATGISNKTIVKAIKTLNDLQLIQSWQMRWVDPKTGKKSEKHITAFRILVPKLNTLSKKSRV